jgi:hypothetical protein
VNSVLFLDSTPLISGGGGVEVTSLTIPEIYCQAGKLYVNVDGVKYELKAAPVNDDTAAALAADPPLESEPDRNLWDHLKDDD